jgi:hypothetical protein
MSIDYNRLYSRRLFLLSASALSITSLPCLGFSEEQVHMHADDDASLFQPTPHDTLLKFNTDGSPRSFSGNTVVCHLPLQSPIRDAVVQLGAELRLSPFAHKLGLLPDDSYHITILGGANDQDRGRYGWPSDIPIDAPMSECNRLLCQRITHFRVREELPLRFRVSAERTLKFQRASGIQVDPLDQNEIKKLHSIRNRMADDVFRFRAEGHNSFRFHISLAYQLRPFTNVERNQYQEMMVRHLEAIIATVPVIELGEPEFCTFHDMYRFEIQSLLRT